MIAGHIGATPPAQSHAPIDAFAEAIARLVPGARAKRQAHSGVWGWPRETRPGVVEFYVTDEEGREMAWLTLSGPATAHRDAALRAMHDIMYAACPAVPLRERLTVCDGGNKPTKGRPRTKRRLRIVG